MALWLSSFGIANAQCRVCDEVVEMDQTLASCFVRQFAAIEKAVASAPSGRMKIDLSGCKGVQTDGERGGLLSMPSLTEPARRLKSVFILDLPYAKCLHDLLTEIEGPIDPTVEFDLFVQCRT
ncbi:MAG: hypothetical protein ACSHWS_09960 [Sulfitobacter sp.]